MIKSICLLLAFCLTVSISVATAQEAEIPREVRAALGGLASISLYNAQVAADRAAKADVSDEASFKKAITDLGGMKGGLGNCVKVLTGAKVHLSPAEAATMDRLIDMNNTVIAEIEAAITLQRARGTGGSTATAQADYDAKRAEAIKKFEALGFTPNLFE